MKRRILTIALLASTVFYAAAQGRGRGNDRSERGNPHYEESFRGRGGHGEPRGNAYGHYKNRHNRNHHRNAEVRVVVNRPRYHRRVIVDPGYRSRRIVYRAPAYRGIYVDVNLDRRYLAERRLLRPYEVDNIRFDMNHFRRDNRRLEFAKNSLRGRKIQSRDVVKLMRELEFEENRLELAKFAYRRTIDKRNYEFIFNQLRTDWARIHLDEYLLTL